MAKVLFTAPFIPLIFLRALGQHGGQQDADEGRGSDKASSTVHEEFQEAARNFDELIAGVWMELVKQSLGTMFDPLGDCDVLKAFSERYPRVRNREDVGGCEFIKRPRKLRC